MTISGQDKPISRKMKAFRKAAHITQQELAELMSVSQPAIVKLERGGYDTMNVTNLSKYAEALGYTMHIIFEEN